MKKFNNKKMLGSVLMSPLVILCLWMLYDIVVAIIHTPGAWIPIGVVVIFVFFIIGAYTYIKEEKKEEENENITTSNE